MPRFILLAPLWVCVVFRLSAAPAAAECKDLKQFIRDETAGAEKYVDMFTFRRDHRGDSVLMFVKDSVEKGRLPKRWLFLHRDAETTTEFCVAGRGEEIGHNEQTQASAAAANFGPPGSGFPRCATSTAKVTRRRSATRLGGPGDRARASSSRPPRAIRRASSS